MGLRVEGWHLGEQVPVVRGLQRHLPPPVDLSDLLHLLREKPRQCLAPSQKRAPHSAKRRASLLPRGGRALVKRLGLGVSKVHWMTTFDFVVKVPVVRRLQRHLPHPVGLIRIPLGR